MKRLTLLFAMALLLSLGCTKEKVDERSIVMFMIGDVKKNDAAAQIGDLVKEKDIIQTGVDSFCDIKIGESLVRVKQSTKVLMAALVKKGAMENTTIDLSSGKMLCKPKKLLRSESFLIKTPTSVAGVRGTQFTVEADANGTSRIKVFEGRVKVVKRIKNFDGSIDKILNEAPEINHNEKVTITKQDIEKTEKLVNKIIEAEPGRGEEAALDAVIRSVGNDIFAVRNDVRKFSVEDYAQDNKEIIEIKEKSPEVIKKINKAIKLEKETPKPNGRLLVTRYEVYFIKDGKVEWEGAVVDEPIKVNDRLYIASGDYIFCSSIDGPVLWRKKLGNEGKLLIRNNRLVVPSQEGEIQLDLNTGEKQQFKSN